MFHLVKDQETVARLRHQFEPFYQHLFGSTEDSLKEAGRCNGTIFRFPLRMQQNHDSDLSSTVYDVTKVKALAQSLLADAPHILLFLKNIESIQVYEKLGPNDRNPQLLFEVRIPEKFIASVNSGRRTFMTEVAKSTEDWRHNKPIASVYPVAFEILNKQDKGSEVTTASWFVSHYHAGEDSAEDLPDDEELGYLPVVGVAVEFDTETDTPDLCAVEPKGHIFCSLPLPLEPKSPTGLRIHVNGSFAIEQNRRHIKWPTAHHAGKRRDSALLWNQFLVNTLVPKCMLELISKLILVQKLDKGTTDLMPQALNRSLQTMAKKSPERLARLVYAILPDAMAISPQFRAIVDAFKREVSNGRAMFYSASVNSWLLWKDADI
jgi:sacsin